MQGPLQFDIICIEYVRPLGVEGHARSEAAPRGILLDHSPGSFLSSPPALRLRWSHTKKKMKKLISCRLENYTWLGDKFVLNSLLVGCQSKVQTTATRQCTGTPRHQQHEVPQVTLQSARCSQSTRSCSASSTRAPPGHGERLRI